jgi:hypothetical protein
MLRRPHGTGCSQFPASNLWFAQQAEPPSVAMPADQKSRGYTETVAVMICRNIVVTLSKLHLSHPLFFEPASPTWIITSGTQPRSPDVLPQPGFRWHTGSIAYQINYLQRTYTKPSKSIHRHESDDHLFDLFSLTALTLAFNASKLAIHSSDRPCTLSAPTLSASSFNHVTRPVA